MLTGMVLTTFGKRKFSSEQWLMSATSSIFNFFNVVIFLLLRNRKRETDLTLDAFW